MVKYRRRAIIRYLNGVETTGKFFKNFKPQKEYLSNIQLKITVRSFYRFLLFVVTKGRLNSPAEQPKVIDVNQNLFIIGGQLIC